MENAILHGVSEMAEGYIKLWTQQKDGTLIINVSDNGRGMAADVLDTLNSPDKRILGGHLGLYNVNSIIRLYFGSEYGITAQLEAGGGSRVSVLLPLRRKEDAGV